MRSFFDPVIEKVLQIVSDQIANAVDQTGLSMDVSAESTVPEDRAQEAYG